MTVLNGLLDVFVANSNLAEFTAAYGLLGFWGKRHLIIPTVHLITTVLRLFRPSGVRGVVAESVVAKHQFMIVNRSRHVWQISWLRDRPITGFSSVRLGKSSRLRRESSKGGRGAELRGTEEVVTAKLPH